MPSLSFLKSSSSSSATAAANDTPGTIGPTTSHSSIPSIASASASASPSGITGVSPSSLANASTSGLDPLPLPRAGTVPGPAPGLGRTHRPSPSVPSLASSFTAASDILTSPFARHPPPSRPGMAPHHSSPGSGAIPTTTAPGSASGAGVGGGNAGGGVRSFSARLLRRRGSSKKSISGPAPAVPAGQVSRGETPPPVPASAPMSAAIAAGSSTSGLSGVSGMSGVDSPARRSELDAGYGAVGYTFSESESGPSEPQTGNTLEPDVFSVQQQQAALAGAFGMKGAPTFAGEESGMDIFTASHEEGLQDSGVRAVEEPLPPQPHAYGYATSTTAQPAGVGMTSLPPPPRRGDKSRIASQRSGASASSMADSAPSTAPGAGLGVPAQNGAFLTPSPPKPSPSPSATAYATASASSPEALHLKPKSRAGLSTDPFLAPALGSQEVITSPALLAVINSRLPDNHPFEPRNALHRAPSSSGSSQGHAPAIVASGTTSVGGEILAQQQGLPSAQNRAQLSPSKKMLPRSPRAQANHDRASGASGVASGHGAIGARPGAGDSEGEDSLLLKKRTYTPPMPPRSSSKLHSLLTPSPAHYPTRLNPFAHASPGPSPHRPPNSRSRSDTHSASQDQSGAAELLASPPIETPAHPSTYFHSSLARSSSPSPAPSPATTPNGARQRSRSASSRTAHTSSYLFAADRDIPVPSLAASPFRSIRNWAKSSHSQTPSRMRSETPDADESGLESDEQGGGGLIMRAPGSSGRRRNPPRQSTSRVSTSSGLGGFGTAAGLRGYEVTVECIELAAATDGEEAGHKWEISIRPRPSSSVSRIPSQPVSLSSGETTSISAPISLSSVNFSLSLDGPSGTLTLPHPAPSLHATPTRSRTTSNRSNRDQGVYGGLGYGMQGGGSLLVDVETGRELGALGMGGMDHTPAYVRAPDDEDARLPHARGGTFGGPISKVRRALVDSDSSPSPITRTQRSAKVERTLDREMERDLEHRGDTVPTDSVAGRPITPPPRMQTPPPMPSPLAAARYGSGTPSHSHSRTPRHSAGAVSPRRVLHMGGGHSRSLSAASAASSAPWSPPHSLSPAAIISPGAGAGTSRRTPPNGHRDLSAIGLGSPSPRSTPRRHRIVSAQELNGGLYAAGTVDGLSEELEGVEGVVVVDAVEGQGAEVPVTA